MYVNLGIKGADKAVGALSSVKTGLGDISSMSLEAKAGIAAVLYGLEKLVNMAGARGTSLTNFSALMGFDEKGLERLQRFQYAAHQAKISNEELNASLKGVSDTMAMVRIGKAPESYGIVAGKVGLDPKQDDFYNFLKLQEFAKIFPKAWGRNLIKQFGVSEGVIAGMDQGVFNEKNFKAAPILSGAQTHALNRQDVAWGNIENRAQVSIEKIMAAHGDQLIATVDALIKALTALTNVFLDAADKLGFFKDVGDTSKVLSDIGNIPKDKKGIMHGIMHADADSIKGFLNLRERLGTALLDAILPKGTPGTTGAKGTKTNGDVNVHFHGPVTDPKAVEDHAKKGVKHALRTSSANSVVA